MDTSLSAALTRLAQGELLPIRDGQGQGIAVFHGRVWITQDADRRDIILGPGESFAFDRPGLAIVQALAATSVLMFAPSAQSPAGGDGGAHATRSQLGGAGMGQAPISSYELHRAARRMRSKAIGDAVLGLAAAVRVLWERLLARAATHADIGAHVAAYGAGNSSGGTGHGRRA